MSEREDIINRLHGLACALGYDRGPGYFEPVLDMFPTGGKFRKFGISVPARMDATVAVIRADHIRIGGGAFNQPLNVTFTSEEECAQWLVNRGWI